MDPEPEQMESDVEISLDEFSSFMLLPTNVKEKILSFCDFNAMIDATVTCKELNELVFSTAKLERRITLKVCWNESIDEVIDFLETCKRQYKSLKVDGFVNPTEELTQLTQRSRDYLKNNGYLIHELSIRIEKFDVVEVLMHCPNLKKLSLLVGGRLGDINRHPILPNLTFLELEWFNIKYLKALKNVDSLECVKVFSTCKCCRDVAEAESITVLEDFILQQHKLTRLYIDSPMENDSFLKNRANEVKFMLECFGIWKIESLYDPNHFFDRQSESLKTLEINDIAAIDITVLTKLTNLKLSDKITVDAISVKGFEKRSLKTLRTENYLFSTYEQRQIVQIFPNILDVQVSCLFTYGFDDQKSRESQESLYFGKDFVGFLVITGKGCSSLKRGYSIPSFELPFDLLRDFRQIIDFIGDYEKTLKCITIETDAWTDLGREFVESLRDAVLRMVPHLSHLDILVIPDTHRGKERTFPCYCLDIENKQHFESMDENLTLAPSRCRQP